MIQIKSSQIHLYSAFHNIHCFKAPLQKVILSKMECFKIKQVFGLAGMSDIDIEIDNVLLYLLYCLAHINDTLLLMSEQMASFVLSESKQFSKRM